MPYMFRLTNAIVSDLMVIQTARDAVGSAVLHPSVSESLRRKARVRSTHFSTRIEGNRLTLKQAGQALAGDIALKGRERDVAEVKNYYAALQKVEEWADAGIRITEDRIRKMHALIHKGPRAPATAYRKEQNVIRDAATGALVYLPPEAKDIPRLIGEMFAWLAETKAQEIPVPVAAGVAHYQFVTVHPFYDGNGRTARMLATWILYQGGYDLGRFFSLEEFYANDLEGYYTALQTHPGHNYYEGRDRADITNWLEYFVHSMAEVFRRVSGEVAGKSRISRNVRDNSLIMGFDRRARIVLGLFSDNAAIVTRQAAAALGLSDRQTRDLLRRWVRDGWLIVLDASNKSRRYGLSEEYRRFIGGAQGLE